MENSDDKFKVVEKYFDPEKWNNMGSYERERYLRVYNNYMEMISLDFDIPKPDFIEDYEISQAAKTKKQRNKKNVEKSSKSASVEEYDELLDVCNEMGDKGFTLKETRLSKKNFKTISDMVKEMQINLAKKIKHCEKTHHIYILETLGEIKEDKKSETQSTYRNKRYPKRNIKRVDYTEEDIPLDYYIYCDRCQREWEGCFCPFHGPLLNCYDNKVPKDEKNLMRAMHTVPTNYLCIRQSAIPNAGYGVWTIKCMPIGVRFGPYEGVDTVNGNDDGYCWSIRKDGRTSHYVDGKPEGLSNWMRYVNCSRNVAEQNLVAFQFLGKLYYRTIRNIYPHSELLVWYGDEYGKRLGIDSKTHNAPLGKKLLPANDFPCTGCGTNFSTPIYMELHRRRCTKFRTAMYHHSTTLAAQKQDQNEVVIEDIKNNIKSNQSSSNDCKQPNQINNIKKHKNIINGDSANKKQFECNQCDYITNNKSNLNQHIKGVHLNARPFKCNECNATFTQNSNLNQHKKAVHLNARPFKCTECNATFTTNGNLNQHINGVHLNARPFKCTECNATFTQNSSLKTHIKIVHLNERPFKCTECNATFTQGGHLNQHIKRIHNKK